MCVCVCVSPVTATTRSRRTQVLLLLAMANVNTRLTECGSLPPQDRHQRPPPPPTIQPLDYFTLFYFTLVYIGTYSYIISAKEGARPFFFFFCLYNSFREGAKWIEKQPTIRKYKHEKLIYLGYIYILAATPALGGPLAGQGAKPPGHPAPNLAPQPLSTSALTLHPVFAFLAP